MASEAQGRRGGARRERRGPTISVRTDPAIAGTAVHGKKGIWS
jgi:hypothetical protein